MPYWISTILFWQLVLAADFFLSSHFNADTLLLFNLFLYGSYAGGAVIIEFCNREMQRFFPRLLTFVSEPPETIRQWYLKNLHNAYMSRSSFVCGALFGILGTISVFELIITLSEGIPALIAFRAVASILGFFLMGTGIWAIFAIIRTIHELSGLRIDVKLLAIGNDSVMALGTLFLRMSLALSGVYILIVLSSIFGNTITSPAVLFWHGIAIISILLFFIVPQYRIHKIMINEKNQRLQSFTLYLEKTMNESLNEPSVEKLQHLKELFELKNHLSEMHEWTFRSGTISQLISVLIIPLMLVLLEVYMSR